MTPASPTTGPIFEDNLGATGDAVYAALMSELDGLSLAEAQAFTARLVLILANEISDSDRLEVLLRAARPAA